MDTSTKEEDDTWTQVKRRPGRRLKNSSATDVRAQPSLVNPQPRPASELEAEYRKIRQQWQQSSCFSALQKSTRHRFNPKTALKRAICLGIGTFDPVDGGWEARRRTYTQFIAFVTMVETLESAAGSKILCYFQDPIFNTSDKEFIENLGHSVIETPRAFEMIDDTTFLYGVHLYWPIYAQALAAASTPAVFVGTGFDVWDGLDMSSTRRSENMTKMETTYTKDAFPQDTTGTAFSTTSIYWRPDHDL